MLPLGCRTAQAPGEPHFPNIYNAQRFLPTPPKFSTPPPISHQSSRSPSQSPVFVFYLHIFYDWIIHFFQYRLLNWMNRLRIYCACVVHFIHFTYAATDFFFHLLTLYKMGVYFISFFSSSFQSLKYDIVVSICLC